jgi:hypothetical protein
LGKTLKKSELRVQLSLQQHDISADICRRVLIIFEVVGGTGQFQHRLKKGNLKIVKEIRKMLSITFEIPKPVTT